MKNIKLMNGKLLSGIAAVLMLAALVVGCKQTVDTPVAVTGVTLNKTALTLEEGTTEKLTAKVNPENAANKKLTWSSDNKEVAEVNQDGTVRAKKVGIAKITVTTEDGSKTADCTVTVTPPKYQITFSVEGGHGTLTAKVGEGAGAVELKTGAQVEQGKTVTFTAVPEANYTVEKWTLDGVHAPEAGTGTTYTLTVTKPAIVKVSFKHISHEVTFGVENTEAGVQGGTLKAKVEGTEADITVSPASVELHKTLTFTAKPDAQFAVDAWQVLPETALQSGGTAGSPTATVEVSAAVTVKVKFKYVGDTLELESQAFTKGKTEKFTYTLVKAGSGNYTAEPEDPAVISVELDNATGEATVQCVGVGSTRIKVKDALSGQEQYSGYITVPEGAFLTLSPDKKDIKVKAKTKDGSPIKVTGCNETTLANDSETTLNATDTAVILEGNITELELYNNKLTALNVQGCAALQRLICGDNQLVSLNLQGLTALQRLECYSNNLTEFNVQGLTALQRLLCFDNQLSLLNVQDLNALQKLECNKNKLTELNVQGLTALQELNCENNELTSLNVEGCTALKDLYCGSNQLTDIDVQGLTALELLKCGNNRLSALDVQGLTALQWLNCENNELTSLNVQGLTALIRLECHRNQFTVLNVQGLRDLEWLRCYGNKLNAKVMTKLLNDLPELQSLHNPSLCFLYTEQTGVTEGNHKDFTAPPELKAAFDNAKDNKHWNMYKINEHGHEDELE